MRPKAYPPAPLQRVPAGLTMNYQVSHAIQLPRNAEPIERNYLRVEQVCDLKMCVTALKPDDCRKLLDSLNDKELTDTVYDRALCFPFSDFARRLRGSYIEMVQQNAQNEFSCDGILQDIVDDKLSKWLDKRYLTEPDFKAFEDLHRDFIIPSVDNIGAHGSISLSWQSKRNTLVVLQKIGMACVNTPAYSTARGRACFNYYDPVSRAVSNIVWSFPDEDGKKWVMSGGLDTLFLDLATRGKALGILIGLEDCLSPSPAAPFLYALPWTASGIRQTVPQQAVATQQETLPQQMVAHKKSAAPKKPAAPRKRKPGASQKGVPASKRQQTAAAPKTEDHANNAFPVDPALVEYTGARALQATSQNLPVGVTEGWIDDSDHSRNPFMTPSSAMKSIVPLGAQQGQSAMAVGYGSQGQQVDHLALAQDNQQVGHIGQAQGIQRSLPNPAHQDQQQAVHDPCTPQVHDAHSLALAMQPDNKSEDAIPIAPAEDPSSAPAPAPQQQQQQQPRSDPNIASFDHLLESIQKNLFHTYRDDPPEMQGMRATLLQREIEGACGLIWTKTRDTAEEDIREKGTAKKTVTRALYALLWIFETCALDYAMTPLSAELARVLRRDTLVGAFWQCVIRLTGDEMKEMLKHVINPSDGISFEAKLEVVIQNLEAKGITGYHNLRHALENMRIGSDASEKTSPGSGDSATTGVCQSSTS